MIFFSHKPEIMGFDTETYRGDLKLICNSETYYELNHNKPTELLDWLYYNSKELNFFFNIRFDFSVILRPFLSEENGKDVKEEKRLIVDKYEIKFIDRKFFSIKVISTRNKNYPIKAFFDIAQFYKDKDGNIMSLDNAGKQELGEGKNAEELGLDREKIGNTENYYEEHREEAIKYCIQDAKLTTKLAEKRVDVFAELFDGKYPKKYFSSASIAKAYLYLRHNDEYNGYYTCLTQLPPKIRRTAFDYISQTYHGGIFYDKIFGKIDNVNEEDINSAYPDKIRKLKSIVGAEIRYTDKYISDADYGFYRVKMKFTEKPFPYKHMFGYILYPVSDELIDNYLTIPEIEYLKKHNIPVEVIDGFIVNTTGKLAFPDYEELYQLRKKYPKETHSGMNWGIKTIMNASYGCFAESKNGLTLWSNFIYASYITAETRIQLLELNDELEEKGCRVVSFRTDALIYTGDYFKDSKELGDFGLEFKGHLIYNYMSGFSIDVNKDVNKTKLSKRGFASMKASDLLNATGDTLTILDKEKPVSLNTGIIEHRIQDIGNFEKKEKSMRLKSLSAKYIIPESELTFENFKNKEIIPQQNIVWDAPVTFKISNEKYDKWKNLCDIVKYNKEKKEKKELSEDEFLEKWVIEEFKDIKFEIIGERNE